MATEVLQLAEGDYRACIRRAAGVLAEGGLVAFPTETVYGVGARADKAAPVAALRRLKGRDTRPFTLHIGDPAAVDQYVPDMAGLARRLVGKAWPGPVTFVFPVAQPGEAPFIRTAGEESIERLFFENTIGVRCPDDAAARDLLDAVQAPVVAASANHAGQPPPREAGEVLAALDGAVDLLLDGGTTRYAQPSTVVRLDERGWQVLRPGVIDERTLRRMASLFVLFVCSGNTCRSPMAEALCRTLISGKVNAAPEQLAGKGIFVTSAGTFAGVGSPPSVGAVEAMALRSIDLSGHRSQPLTPELVHQADHVFCMTTDHVDTVLSLAPSARDKARLLDEGDAIRDPFGGSVADYKLCAVHIEEAVQAKMAEIDL